jgi:two-component system sensor histidine kinase DesK
MQPDTCAGRAGVARPVPWLLAALAWLTALLIGPTMDAFAAGDASGTRIAALVTVAASTAASVVAGVTLHGRRRLWVTLPSLTLLAMTAVATTLAFGEPWWNVWVLLGAAATGVVPGAWGLLTVAAVPLLAAVTVGGSGATAAELWPLVLVVFLAAGANHVLVRLLETVGALRAAQEALAARAVVEERERFSRDLHDLLGHTLSVVVVKAEAARRLAERDPQAAAGHARDIEGMGRRALGEVRDAVDGYRRPTLAAEVRRARAALDAAGIGLDVRLPDQALTRAADEVLGWVVREGVTNVLRHSRATRCRLAVGSDCGVTWLELADDGPGDDDEGLEERGLHGLRQRLAAVDGELVAEASVRGFRVRASVPDPGAVVATAGAGAEPW